MIRCFVILFISLYFNIVTYCDILVDSKAKTVKRFVSIKSREVNVRSGPSSKCPIKWIFVVSGEPVEIIAEYDHWRQIQDFDNNIGWVHSSLLSHKRSVIVNSKEIIPLLKSPNSKMILANVGPNVRCKLLRCNNKWCKVLCDQYSGWIEKINLWGVYDNEKF